MWHCNISNRKPTQTVPFLLEREDEMDTLQGPKPCLHKQRLIHDIISVWSHCMRTQPESLCITRASATNPPQSYPSAPHGPHQSQLNSLIRKALRPMTCMGVGNVKIKKISFVSCGGTHPQQFLGKASRG